MVKRSLTINDRGFSTFQRKKKNDDILELKLIILFEMWICIPVIAKLLILLVL